VEVERQRYQELFEFAPDAYLVTDTLGVIREANRAAGLLLNVEPRYLAGKPLVNFFPAERRREFRARLINLATRTHDGGVAPSQFWGVPVQPRHGESFHAAMTVGVVRDRNGCPVALWWLFRDVSAILAIQERLRTVNAELDERVRERTAQLEAALREKEALLARERDARADAEAAQQRLIFLAGASSLLSASMEYPEVLQRLASFIVPHLADGCAIDLIEEGRLTRVAERGPGDRPGSASPLPPASAWVLRTGEPKYYPEAPAALLETLARDAEPRTPHWELGSYLCAPLPGRGRILGALTLVTLAPGRLFSSLDLAVAEDLARRAATALENSRLYRTLRVEEG
jgi:PAS domain S-box-containing protein